jgi:hypothetical protein
MAVLGTTTLTGCNSIPDFIAAGTLMTFQQTTAPTSWTKQTTHNNKSLRVVSGTAGSGGNTAFTSVFTSRTPTGSVSVSNAAHTLTAAQMPSHTHVLGSFSATGNKLGFGPNNIRVHGDPNYFNFDGGARASEGAGSSNSHTHNNTATFAGTALDFAVQYVDIIIASKN